MYEPESITDILDKSKCYCLNEQVERSFLELLPIYNNAEPNPDRYLRSQIDPEIIIHLTFRELVNISHIEFEVRNNSGCPKTVKRLTF
jgi:hypothetical protein